MSEIRFEELPALRRGPATAGTKWARIAEQLRSRPGDWAHVLTANSVQGSGSMAYYLRRGGPKAWPRGAFEAVARKVDGEYRVYARYIGPTP